MSSALIMARGGSKDLVGAKGEIKNTGMFISNTMANRQGSVNEKYLGNLVQNTTGMPSDMPVMDGVLHDTKQGTKSMNVPELQKTHNKGKTQPKRMGQVPFAGKMY